MNWVIDWNAGIGRQGPIETIGTSGLGVDGRSYTLLAPMWFQGFRMILSHGFRLDLIVIEYEEINCVTDQQEALLS